MKIFSASQLYPSRRLMMQISFILAALTATTLAREQAQSNQGSGLQDHFKKMITSMDMKKSPELEGIMKEMVEMAPSSEENTKQHVISLIQKLEASVADKIEAESTIEPRMQTSADSPDEDPAMYSRMLKRTAGSLELLSQLPAGMVAKLLEELKPLISSELTLSGDHEYDP